MGRVGGQWGGDGVAVVLLTARERQLVASDTPTHRPCVDSVVQRGLASLVECGGMGVTQHSCPVVYFIHCALF